MHSRLSLVSLRSSLPQFSSQSTNLLLWPTPEDNTVNLFRQMLQAQDEQIRAQQGQISQLTEMVKTLAVASASAANAASSTAAPGASGTLPSGQEDSAGLGSLRVDADGIVKMDVDTGLRRHQS